MKRYDIALREMDQVMSRLRRILDIRITFFDMQERELKRLHVKPMSRFCTAFRKRKPYGAQCVLCDKTHLAEAKRLREVIIYHCHTGLIEGMVPLYARKGVYLGAIVFGQLRDSAHPPRANLSPSLKTLYLKLPAYTIEKAEDIGYLLKYVSESMIDNELIRYRNRVWAESVETYITAHLREKITIRRLAAVVGRSASFVAHRFESEFGRTPRQYFLKCRMEEAKHMLQNANNVQETAAQLGFYDAFHFSKTFKRFWGKPPRYYTTP